jgi:hypothetical protein
MKHLAIYIISLLCTGSYIACKKPVTQEELIQTALQLKIKQWKEEQVKNCKVKAMTSAEAYVDSILIVYALPDKLDTIPKPPKPEKPIKPVFKTKPDSLNEQ